MPKIDCKENYFCIKYSEKGGKKVKNVNKLFNYEPISIQNRIKLPSAEIFQVAELSLMQKTEMPEHIQVCDELTYVVSGKAVVLSGDYSSEISAGQIHYIKKGWKHSIVVGNDSYFRYICIGFQLKKGYENNDIFINAMESSPYKIFEDRNNVKSLLALLLDELYLKNTYMEVMINHYLSEIMISIYRSFIGCNTVQDNRINNSTSNFAVYTVIRYIDREFINIKNIQEIFGHISYSQYYISHLFKEKMGMSIKEYVTQKKMAVASEMIQTYDCSVEELTEYLHYESSHTFRQAFKKFYGVSPTEYKRKKKIES